MPLFLAFLLLIIGILEANKKDVVIGDAKLTEVTRCETYKETKRCVVKYEINKTSFYMFKVNPTLGETCSYHEITNMTKNKDYKCNDQDFIKNPQTVNLNPSSNDDTDALVVLAI
jgi:hypothetical protein